MCGMVIDMEDYKELIERLKRPNFCGEQRIAAATAIETLLAERDAAVEELRGICWFCAHGKKWDKAPERSNMTTCDYMKESGVLACLGRKHDCKHWEWRGLKEKGEPDAEK